jgi:hypothetical protein
VGSDIPKSAYSLSDVPPCDVARPVTWQVFSVLAHYGWALTELFNVNYFIVSQTNPHIVPILRIKRW